MGFKLFLVSIFIFLIACNPLDYRNPKNKCEWFLKNSTGNTIILLKNFYSPNYDLSSTYKCNFLGADNKQ